MRPCCVLDAQGNLVLGIVTTRWVGTGKTVLNNKGNPVKQYEPFFSSYRRLRLSGMKHEVCHV